MSEATDRIRSQVAHVRQRDSDPLALRAVLLTADLAEALADLADAADDFRTACGHNPPGRGMPATPRPRSGVIDVRMPRDAWNALCRLSEHTIIASDRAQQP